MTMHILEGNELDTFRDSLALNIFGMTKAQAQKKEICIDCKKDMTVFETNLEKREWDISGLCNSCFDRNAGE